MPDDVETQKKIDAPTEPNEQLRLQLQAASAITLPNIADLWQWLSTIAIFWLAYVVGTGLYGFLAGGDLLGSISAFVSSSRDSTAGLLEGDELLEATDSATVRSPYDALYDRLNADSLPATVSEKGNPQPAASKGGFMDRLRTSFRSVVKKGDGKKQGSSKFRAGHNPKDKIAAKKAKRAQKKKKYQALDATLGTADPGIQKF